MGTETRYRQIDAMAITLAKTEFWRTGPSDYGRYLFYLVVYGSGSETDRLYLQDLRAAGRSALVTTWSPQFSPLFCGDALYLQSTGSAAFHVFAVIRAIWRGSIGSKRFPRMQCGWNRDTSGRELVCRLHKDASSEYECSDADGKNEKAVAVAVHWERLFRFSAGGKRRTFYCFASTTRRRRFTGTTWQKTKQNFGAKSSAV